MEASGFCGRQAPKMTEAVISSPPVATWIQRLRVRFQSFSEGAKPDVLFRLGAFRVAVVSSPALGGSDMDPARCIVDGAGMARGFVHWINPGGREEGSTHWRDKVYKRKNLEVAWEKVKRNRGAGGVDGEDLAAFEASLDANLDRLHRELRDGKYVPQPVLQHLIPKAGQPGKFRPLGIPTIYDRVCQQALLNRLGTDLRAGVR